MVGTESTRTVDYASKIAKRGTAHSGSCGHIVQLAQRGGEQLLLEEHEPQRRELHRAQRAATLVQRRLVLREWGRVGVRVRVRVRVRFGGRVRVRVRVRVRS